MSSLKKCSTRGLLQHHVTLLLSFLGGCSSDLSRWQSNQSGQVPGIHGSDPRSREGPVQVLGRPLPAGEKCGCSDGRAGQEQSRVTGKD